MAVRDDRSDVQRQRQGFEYIEGETPHRC